MTESISPAEAFAMPTSARDIVSLWPSYSFMSRWALDVLRWGMSDGGVEALLAQLRDAQRMQVEASHVFCRSYAGCGSRLRAA